MAYRLYRKKKNSVVSSAPRHTSDDETVRYVATESEEQARVEYPTLSPPNFYDEVGDHSNARVDQDDSNPGSQTGVDTPVYETAPDGIQLQDSPPEWTANPTSNYELLTGEYSTLQSAAGDHEPLTERYTTLQHSGEYELPFFSEEISPINSSTVAEDPHCE